MRYAIVKTQCDDLTDPEQPLHALSKGTLVRILGVSALPVGLIVETMYPVFGTWDMRYMHRTQVLDPSDLYEFPAYSGKFIERLAKVLQSSREFLGIA
jgi:hypothetical protein